MTTMAEEVTTITEETAEPPKVGDRVRLTLSEGGLVHEGTVVHTFDGDDHGLALSPAAPEEFGSWGRGVIPGSMIDSGAVVVDIMASVVATPERAELPPYEEPLQPGTIVRLNSRAADVGLRSWTGAMVQVIRHRFEGSEYDQVDVRRLDNGSSGYVNRYACEAPPVTPRVEGEILVGDEVQINYETGNVPNGTKGIVMGVGGDRIGGEIVLPTHVAVRPYGYSEGGRFSGGIYSIRRNGLEVTGPWGERPSWDAELKVGDTVMVVEADGVPQDFRRHPHEIRELRMHNRVGRQIIVISTNARERDHYGSYYAQAVDKGVPKSSEKPTTTNPLPLGNRVIVASQRRRGTVVDKADASLVEFYLGNEDYAAVRMDGQSQAVAMHVDDLVPEPDPSTMSPEDRILRLQQLIHRVASYEAVRREWCDEVNGALAWLDLPEGLSTVDRDLGRRLGRNPKAIFRLDVDAPERTYKVGVEGVSYPMVGGFTVTIPGRVTVEVTKRAWEDELSGDDFVSEVRGTLLAHLPEGAPEASPEAADHLSFYVANFERK